MAASLDAALGSIPAGLRTPLLCEFKELLSEYRAGDWEKVGLKAGKICEIVYSIIDGFANGAFASSPSKPSNMVDACRALEHAGNSFSRSIRIQLPRIIIATYELRNNRAIGHTGGEVNPNHMDAEFFLRACKWMLAELVRNFSSLDEVQASSLVESVTERVLPAVWENAGKKKILNTSLSHRERALVLTYATPEGVSARELCSWTGYSNLSRFRGSILKGLDDDALVSFDPASDRVIITPKGTNLVESSNLLKLSV